ncbi:MAG: hypothetical protein SFW67_20775 [Myxococcaceae bacterium]|nr:hypothetical protein [Myxococcaceae bacterium]
MPVVLVMSMVMAAAPERVAVMSVSAVGLSPELQQYAAERLGTALSQRGVKVTTQQDIANVLGLERQRQLLGCDASASCAAELAAALGADAVLSWTVAKLGGAFDISAKVVASLDLRVLAVAQARAMNEEGLPFAIDEVAGQLASRLLPVARPSLGLTLGVPLGVAGAALLAGGLLLGSATVDAASLTSSPGPQEAPLVDGRLRASSIVTRRDFSLVAFGLSVSAATLGIVWTLLTRPPVETGPSAARSGMVDEVSAR